MRALPRLAGVAIVALLAALSSGHAKPKKASTVDFTPYKGNYLGSWTMAVNASVATAQVNTQIIVPKSGKTMTLLITGVVHVQNQVIPINTTIKFGQKRRVSGTAVLLGYLGPVPALPGKYAGKNGNFSFSQIAVPGALFAGQPIIGGTSYSLRLKKRSFTLTGFGNATVLGNPSTFSFLSTAGKIGK